MYGDDNTVTINSVNDLIKEYVALTKRNDTLEKQNQQYFDENTDLKEIADSCALMPGSYKKMTHEEILGIFKECY